MSRKRLTGSASPCVTVRDETEWVETVESAENLVVGSDAGAVKDAVPAPERCDTYGEWDGFKTHCDDVERLNVETAR